MASTAAKLEQPTGELYAIAGFLLQRAQRFCGGWR
jgi:hypothetical protein